MVGDAGAWEIVLTRTARCEALRIRTDGKSIIKSIHTRTYIYTLQCVQWELGRGGGELYLLQSIWLPAFGLMRRHIKNECGIDSELDLS